MPYHDTTTETLSRMCAPNTSNKHPDLVYTSTRDGREVHCFPESAICGINVHPYSTQTVNGLSADQRRSDYNQDPLSLARAICSNVVPRDSSKTYLTGDDLRGCYEEVCGKSLAPIYWYARSKRWESQRRLEQQANNIGNNAAVRVMRESKKRVKILVELDWHFDFSGASSEICMVITMQLILTIREAWARGLFDSDGHVTVWGVKFTSPVLTIVPGYGTQPAHLFKDGFADTLSGHNKAIYLAMESLTFGRTGGKVGTNIKFRGDYTVDVREITDDGVACTFLAYNACQSRQPYEISRMMEKHRYADCDPSEKFVNLIGGMAEVYRFWGLPTQQGDPADGLNGLPFFEDANFALWCGEHMSEIRGHTQTSDLLHRASNNNGRGASPVPCACLSGDNEDTWKKCIEVQNFVEYNALRRRSYENIRDNFRNMPNEKHDESDRERQAYQQCPFNGMNPKFVQNYMPDIGEIPQALTEVFAGELEEWLEIEHPRGRAQFPAREPRVLPVPQGIVQRARSAIREGRGRGSTPTRGEGRGDGRYIPDFRRRPAGARRENEAPDEYAGFGFSNGRGVGRGT